MMKNHPDFQNILENYKEICYNIENAKIKFCNSEDNIEIMAVTKTVSPEKVNFAISNGIRLLGENRVQEYLSKKDLYDKSAKVHMIGHLQTNKVKYIINDVSMIQSVDSLRLANEINKYAEKNNKIMDILIEVNIGDENTKNGIKSKELFSLIDSFSELKNISINGLMAIPPIKSDEKIYADMHELFLRLKQNQGRYSNVNMKILSMGMSGDYVKAIKYGSNIVRIGTKLFGARK